MGSDCSTHHEPQEKAFLESPQDPSPTTNPLAGLPQSQPIRSARETTRRSRHRSQFTSTITPSQTQTQGQVPTCISTASDPSSNSLAQRESFTLQMRRLVTEDRLEAVGTNPVDVAIGDPVPYTTWRMEFTDVVTSPLGSASKSSRGSRTASRHASPSTFTATVPNSQFVHHGLLE
jgi:hypothetical protein